mmetsp:Transcript_34226/g.66675  ORF Transcript_34226/g.66675 Transcript_34226/m.66675 type:complete len:94 (+) Transcript_34226:656-937(+)
MRSSFAISKSSSSAAAAATLVRRQSDDNADDDNDGDDDNADNRHDDDVDGDDGNVIADPATFSWTARNRFEYGGVVVRHGEAKIFLRKHISLD